MPIVFDNVKLRNALSSSQTNSAIDRRHPRRYHSPSKEHANSLSVSDTASKDPSTDRSGPILKELFSAASDTWAIHSVAIVPDETSAIQSQVISWSDEGVNLIITSGGTGFAIRDITPEVISAIRL